MNVKEAYGELYGSAQAPAGGHGPATRMVPIGLKPDLVSASSGWVTVPGPCRAVGFTGTLPPGAMLVAIDMVDYGRVKDSLLTSPDLSELAVSFDRTSTTVFDAGGVVLRRGQVHDFGRQLSGVCLAVIWPYMNHNNRAQYLTSALVLETRLAGGTTIPRPAALAVVYSDPPGAGELPFTKCHLSYVGIPIALVDPTTPDVQLPPDAETVLVQFTDNAADAEIVGAETGNFEVHWATMSGTTGLMYAHAHSDDFDAAGVGSVVRLNNAALFTIPKGAIGISVIQPTTAAAFWAFFHVM